MLAACSVWSWASADLLVSRRSCLELANKEGLATIAFPAISCGVYAFPLPRAAEARASLSACPGMGAGDSMRISTLPAVQVAVQTCADAAGDLREVHFVLFSSDTFTTFCKAAESFAEGRVPDAAK